MASKRAEIILQIEKLTQIRLRIVKPRGIVIAGSTAEFTATPAKRDYFRLLNEGLKNVEIVPYDELSRRLKNTVLSIKVLNVLGVRIQGDVPVKGRHEPVLGRRMQNCATKVHDQYRAGGSKLLDFQAGTEAPPDCPCRRRAYCLDMGTKSLLISLMTHRCIGRGVGAQSGQDPSIQRRRKAR